MALLHEVSQRGAVAQRLRRCKLGERLRWCSKLLSYHCFSVSHQHLLLPFPFSCHPLPTPSFPLPCRELLTQHPQHQPAHQLLLRCPTVGSLAVLSQRIEQPGSEVWQQTILPRIEELLSRMKPLVTGSQEDQEVINLLRDGAREWYFSGSHSHSHSQSRSRSKELGKAFFLAVCGAMARGYGDTERLPELAARILRVHAEEGSADWFQQALAGAAAAGLQSSPALRSFSDTLHLLLGLESSNASYGVEESSAAAAARGSATGDAFAGELLQSLAAHPSSASFLLWKELADTQPRFLRSHSAALEACLRSARDLLGELERRAAPDKQLTGTLRNAVRALFAMAPCAGKQSAAAAFAALAKVSQLRHKGLLKNEQVEYGAGEGTADGAAAVATGIGGTASGSYTHGVLISHAEQKLSDQGLINGALTLAALQLAEREAALEGSPASGGSTATPLRPPRSPQELPVSALDIATAFVYADGNLKTALASLVPFLCCSEAEPSARIAAVNELARRSASAFSAVLTAGSAVASAGGCEAMASLLPQGSFGAAAALLRAFPADKADSDFALIKSLREHATALAELEAAVTTVGVVDSSPTGSTASAGAAGTAGPAAGRLSSVSLTPSAGRSSATGASADVRAGRLFAPMEEFSMHEGSLLRSAPLALAVCTASAIAAAREGRDAAVQGLSKLEANKAAVGLFSAAVGRIIKAAVGEEKGHADGSRET